MRAYGYGSESRIDGIINAYSETLRPVSEIADEFGITQAGLYGILERYKVPRRAERGINLRKLKSTDQVVHRVISPFHAAVGATLKERRRRVGTTIREFSVEVGLTQVTLRRIEGGTYDWKLSQVQRICSHLKLPIDVMVQTATLQSIRFQNAA